MYYVNVWTIHKKRKQHHLQAKNLSAREIRRSLKLNDNYKFDTPKHSDLRDQNLNNEILVQIKITGEMNSWKA